MQKLLILFFLGLFISDLTTFARARSVKPCRDLLVPSPVEIKEAKELVKKSKVYKKLLENKGTEIKINLNVCSAKVGNIRVNGYHDQISQKKCWIDQLNFDFKIENNKVVFAKLPFGENTIEPDKLSHSLIRSSLQKIAQSPLIGPFFKSNNFCQIKYQNSQGQVHWIVQLRNKTNKVCYLQTSLNGEQIEIIKRLYAKNSECHIEKTKY